jgi:hypothetical protein
MDSLRQRVMQVELIVRKGTEAPEVQRVPLSVRRAWAAKEGNRGGLRADHAESQLQLHWRQSQDLQNRHLAEFRVLCHMGIDTFCQFVTLIL